MRVYHPFQGGTGAKTRTICFRGEKGIDRSHRAISIINASVNRSLDLDTNVYSLLLNLEAKRSMLSITYLWHGSWNTPLGVETTIPGPVEKTACQLSMVRFTWLTELEHNVLPKDSLTLLHSENACSSLMIDVHQSVWNSEDDPTTDQSNLRHSQITQSTSMLTRTKPYNGWIV